MVEVNFEYAKLSDDMADFMVFRSGQIDINGMMPN